LEGEHKNIDAQGSRRKENEPVFLDSYGVTYDI
jgi:hypothetical protein